MSTVCDLHKSERPSTRRQETLEKFYRIVGNGKLQMKEDTPIKSEEFKENLRKLIDAKLASRNFR